MKLALLLALAALILPLRAQSTSETAKAAVPKVNSTWPGIVFEVPEVDRLAHDRLFVAIRIRAEASAPPSTLIGTPGVLPPNPTEDQLKTPLIPSPYSLEGCVLTDELSGKTYTQLSPDPHGPVYLPATRLGWLAPGKMLYLSMQFRCPPPPAPKTDGTVPRQTLSLILPRAAGPITGIVLPPLTAPKP